MVRLDSRQKSQRRLNEESKSALSHYEENELMGKMQRILFENAALGDLLILRSKFVDCMQK